MQLIDQRIGSFVQTALGLDEEQAKALRREYFLTYGTTLRGLQQHHAHIDPEHYLHFVHDVAIESFLASDQELDVLLGELPQRKVIFTNSPREHAERVLRAMGIERHFAHIFDIRASQLLPKPNPEPYRYVLSQLGVGANECIMIEDTLVNLAPARELGMTTILVADEAMLQAYLDAGKEIIASHVVGDVLTALRLTKQIVASNVHTTQIGGSESAQ